MTTAASIQLATAILKSAHAHETSYVIGLSDDKPGHYRVSTRDAAYRESRHLAEPVYLMLTSHWNESIYWAETVMGVLGQNAEQRGVWLKGVTPL
jgi:hypothetical protein